MTKEKFNFMFDFSIENEYYVCNIHDCDSQDTIVLDVMKRDSDKDATQYLLHSTKELKDMLIKLKFNDQEIQEAIDEICYEELESAAFNYYINLRQISNTEALDVIEVNPTKEIAAQVINAGQFKNPKYFAAQFLIPNGTKEYFEFNLVNACE